MKRKVARRENRTCTYVNERDPVERDSSAEGHRGHKWFVWWEGIGLIVKALESDGRQRGYIWGGRKNRESHLIVFIFSARVWCKITENKRKTGYRFEAQINVWIDFLESERMKIVRKYNTFVSSICFPF